MTRDRWIPALLLVLAAPVLAQQGSDEKAALRELKAALKVVEKETEERALAAVQAVGRCDTARSAEALVAAYTRLEGQAEAILEGRRKVLLAGGGSGRLATSRRELQPLRNVQDGILAAFGALQSEKATRALVDPLMRVRRKHPLALKLALAERASQLSDEQLEWFTPQRASSRRADGVLTLLRAVAQLGPRALDAAEWARSQLEHDNVDVRREALRTLGLMGCRGSLRPLIDHIDSETGKMRERVLDALVVLTAQHPGNSSASWRAWLEAEGAPYLRGDKILGHGDASIRQRKDDGVTRAGSYFGIAQEGNAILYVVDVSQSMRGNGAPPRGNRDAPPTTGTESKWVRCKKELKQALKSLTPDKTFNIVTFANHVRRFEDEMQQADEDTVGRAFAWIDTLKLELETNIYDALDLSFFLAGRGVKDHYYATEIDTIFFLSDGAPTMPQRDGNRRFGRDVPAQILSAVRRWNALRRVTIHTIGIGLQQRGGGRAGRGRGNGQGRGRGPERFLKDLAAENGGRFVSAK